MLRLDLFTCDRAAFREWHAALLRSDSIARGNLEIAMPRLASLPGVAPADLGLLFAALAGDPVDAALARALEAFDPAAGAEPAATSSLVAGLRDHVVRALGEVEPDAGALEVWVHLADSYHEVDDSRDYLTREVAARIRGVCHEACESALPVFAHAYVDPFARPRPVVTGIPEARP
jgi:hypothetical protein